MDPSVHQPLASISVVIPCRNHRQYLESALGSLLNQKYPHLQLIVMDGGSSDGTTELLREYAPKLHYWQSQPDEGQYEAINQGFQHSSGDVMGWLNADDLLMPGALWTLGSIFGQLQEVEWLTTMAPLYMCAAGSFIECHLQSGYSQEAFLDGMHLPGQDLGFFGFIQQESTFWRRSLWERAGPLDTSYRVAADFDLWSRFFRQTQWLFGTPGPLGAFRYAEGQRSQQAFAQYLTEAKASLQSLRHDLNWTVDPEAFRRYQARTVVRRSRGVATRAWEITPLSYYHTLLSAWQPHYPD